MPFLQGTPQTLFSHETLQLAANVAVVVLATISAVLLVTMWPLFLQIRKMLAGLQRQMQPVADRARVTAENVEYISAVVRSDVQRVHASVAGLSDRLKDASDRMEERVEEFNALMDVMQGEAESVLLDTAAAVRGVRAGARTMGEGVGARDATHRVARRPDPPPGTLEGVVDEGPQVDIDTA